MSKSNSFVNKIGESSVDFSQPLAYRMATKELDDIVGQDEIMGEGSLLRLMIEARRIRSLVLFGPPGCGKTSIAKVIAHTTDLPFEKLNAVTAGVADLRSIISDTKNPLLNPAGKCILFIDEIHRFNKAQQDLLLPEVENGAIILIGATTENPFFEVNKALISRSLVFQLRALTADALVKLMKKAISDPYKGLAYFNIQVDDESLYALANMSAGDARQALNALELAVLTSKKTEKGSIYLDKNRLLASIPLKSANYDAHGEEHYNTISALIKSIRGSDPQAAIHYLARLLYAGESLKFIARRLLISASEDIGMANPAALQMAMACFQAVDVLGMPEARIPLAETCIMLATSPKSNSAYTAINKALADVKNMDVGNIPLHLCNAEVKGMADLGYGQGYKYPHDYPKNIVKQEYMPEKLQGKIYYEASSNGYEQKLAQWLAKKD